MQQRECFITAYALWVGDFTLGVSGPKVSGIMDPLLETLFTKLEKFHRAWTINHHLSAFNRRITSRLEISTKMYNGKVLIKFTESIITLEVHDHKAVSYSSIRLTKLEDLGALDLISDLVKLAGACGGTTGDAAIKLESKVKKMLRAGKAISEIRKVLRAGLLLVGF